MKKTTFSIIAAIGPNRELGKDNKLLWHIPADLKRFKELTQGHAVIMGRKTFESIGKPLPNRYNVVVTHDRHWKPVSSVDYLTEVEVCHSLEEAISRAAGLSDSEGKEIFIIGGAQIYQQAIKLADRLYLTVVKGKYDADVFFPEYRSVFTKTVFKQNHQSGSDKFTFWVLEKFS
ncbi:dihydrofolate reductase [Patescibacteria group bacterium]|nr:dihydrofolate reductase [Patescibacteria group bacterium]MCL5091526.1 dihydrofolate reductase [Patescibacteria group bacterium]